MREYNPHEKFYYAENTELLLQTTNINQILVIYNFLGAQTFLPKLNFY